MKEQLIKILATISDDYSGTIDALEKYITDEKTKSFEAGCKFMNPNDYKQVIKD